MTFRIEVAPEPCFCPGVQRAFRITTEMLLARKGKVAYSVGPLIHNHVVVSMLSDMGLAVIDPESGKIPPLGGIPAIIRSHGIDSDTEEMLLREGAQIIDATCPIVKRVQNEAAELAKEGYTVVVAGSSEHPEVRSIAGRIKGDVVVLGSVEKARIWSKEVGSGKKKIGIVCQTTRSKDFLEAIAREIKKNCANVVVKDTTCESVSRRLVDTLNLAHIVDAMIIVGGKNSSNTSHLVSICVDAGVPTYWIENAPEIKPEWLADLSSVGVTGGASTPDWIIDEVIFTLEKISEGKAG